MRFSRSGIASLGLGMALAFGSLAVGAGTDDAAAKLAKAPAAVQAAAKKALGDKKIEEFGKEKIGNKVVYEVGYKVGDVDHAVILGESGDVVLQEADLDLSKLPAPVTAAVKKAHPDGKLDEAAKATAGDKHFYLVDVKVGKDTHAIQVNADGTILADDVETPIEE